MRFDLVKMHGCGNDFLFIDYMNAEPPPFYPREIKFFCNRHYGIGADGLVVLTNSKIAHAKWQFFNSDGSEAGMCGNAARCAVRYLSEKHFPDETPLSLETNVGIIRGRPLSQKIMEITLLPEGGVKLEYEHKIIKMEKNAFDVFSVNTGVPHAVVEVKDIRSYPILQVGKYLMNHPAFGPEGTNVTFFQREVGQQIYSTTFERGVEKETFACGTGAAAAAIVYSELYLESLPIEVKVPGGTLTVDLSPVSKMLLLQGPAEFVFEVESKEIPDSIEDHHLFSEKKRSKE